VVITFVATLAGAMIFCWKVRLLVVDSSSFSGVWNHIKVGDKFDTVPFLKKSVIGTFFALAKNATDAYV
jgi:hypothetical protein